MPNGQNYSNQYGSKRINYALAATLLTQGLSFAEIAPQVGAGSVESLRVGLARKGVTLRVTRSIPPTITGVTPTNTSLAVQVAMAATTIIEESGRKLRQSLAVATEHAAGVLEAKPAKNVKEVMQRVPTLRALAETGDRVHGWSAQASAPQWNVTVLDRGEVARPACGVDAPTGSVPAQVAESVTPQAQQVIDVDTVV